MSDKSVKFIAYLLGGLGLVGLSRMLPTAAVGLTTTLVLGVVLMNTKEFTALSNRIIEALGGTPTVATQYPTNPHTLQE